MGLIKETRVGNGSLVFAVDTIFGAKVVEIVGGPFGKKPGDYFGMCLLESKTNDPAIWYPIRDFSTPEDDDAMRDALAQLLVAALNGKKTYVGCMAGQGRTGLVLSLIAKTFGTMDPVEYVRKHYYPHAVETKPQYQYVTQFDAEGVLDAAVMAYEDSRFPQWMPRWVRGWLPKWALARFA